MKPSMLRHHLCPRCGAGGLSLDPAGDPEVLQGRITCPSCEAAYDVEGGVPRFVDRSSYADSFGMQWTIHQKTQLDSHTGRSVSRDRLFAVSGWAQDLSGQLILEAGSGAGRFTEVLAATGATVLTFDLSAAVEANYANNGAHPRVHVFQADIYGLPVRQAAFDKVLCLGVLQHTPDPERSFRSLISHLKPGGEIVFDVYPRRLRTLLQAKYLLRPITRRMDQARLYRIVSRLVPPLIAPTAFLKSKLGRLGARLSPILEYSHLRLPPDLNRAWAILDTFDMYAPAHDHPQSLRMVTRWFESSGFTDFRADYGPNGIVARGAAPASTSP